VWGLVDWGGGGEDSGRFSLSLSLSSVSSADSPKPRSAEAFYIASSISQTQAMFEYRRGRREISSSSFLPLLW
jgi:hypothetical protein